MKHMHMYHAPVRAYEEQGLQIGIKNYLPHSLE